jgi:hypothetical protein
MLDAGVVVVVLKTLTVDSGVALVVDEECSLVLADEVESGA